MSDSTSSGNFNVFDEIRAFAEQVKREHWEELVQDEAIGKLPEGTSIVEWHDAFCAQVDADLAKSIQELHEVNKEHQKYMREAQGRLESVRSQMYDAALDDHISGFEGSTT